MLTNGRDRHGSPPLVTDCHYIPAGPPTAQRLGEIVKNYIVWPDPQFAGFLRAFQETGIEIPFTAETEQATERPELPGLPDGLVTTAIDVAEYWDAKWAALLAHQTQVGPQTIFFRLPVERLRELWSHEYFQQVIGPGVALRNMRETDLFAEL